MFEFMAGLITMGHLIAGLFFLRFWRRTGERLFAAFCCAFWLFAANQGCVALADLPREEASWFYLLRLAGFALIILGIVVKNASPAPHD
jgi:hypothetical protein